MLRAKRRRIRCSFRMYAVLLVLLALHHTLGLAVSCNGKALHPRLPMRPIVKLSEVDPGEVEGTSLRVLKYPHPLLRADNAEVTEFDDSLRKLAKEMFLVMYASQGVGLAAPQVGVNKRLMVFNPDGDRSKWMSETILCNPEIVEFSTAVDVDIEGCLSFPGFTADVSRSSSIKVRYQNARGKWQQKKLRGWVARIFQHEFDHLSGTLYVDRLAASERQRVQPKLNELIAAHGPGGAL